MSTNWQENVAVLLATHNGAEYVEQQIRSLRNNITPFTLHWIDDYSTDRTKDIVRSVSRDEEIDLCEYSHPDFLGIAKSYFQLIQYAQADIYLFCDQDDIWQPGKIDAAYDCLSQKGAAPLLCFSDTLLFSNDKPEIFRPLSDVVGRRRFRRGLSLPSTFEMFSSVIAPGHTQGFTRSLRDIFLLHKSIADMHAFMHDWWMHDIAVASGSVRLLPNAPTSLWRRHGKSFGARFGDTYASRIAKEWKTVQHLRRGMSRHAQGFILAAATLPPTSNRSRLLDFAKLIATLDRRQTPRSLMRITSQALFFPHPILLSAACLSSDATL